MEISLCRIRLHFHFHNKNEAVSFDKKIVHILSTLTVIVVHILLYSVSTPIYSARLSCILELSLMFGPPYVYFLAPSLPTSHTDWIFSCIFSTNKTIKLTIVSIYIFYRRLDHVSLYTHKEEYLSIMIIYSSLF